MKTAVAGYPRIGTLRELKFALEKYFRKEISADELTQTAKELRKTHWLIQKEAGIDYITSNDFSYYDIVLDTAFLLNIIPERYKELEVSELDKYLAMARGYQGENGDVKALAMKKWFNTNYHYIVPEVEDSTQIRLTGNKPTYTPFLDCGDNVIVINADKVKFTGKKLDQKVYYSHSDYVGGLKETTLKEMMEKKPEKVIELAVKGMLPKGPLGRQMFTKLHVYAGPDHEQAAQKPEVLKF